MRVWRLNFYYRQKIKFYSMGLRCDGKPKVSDRHPYAGVRDKRVRLRTARKKWRDKFIKSQHEKGLSARGSPLRIKKITPMQAVYDELCSGNRLEFRFVE